MTISVLAVDGAESSAAAGERSLGFTGSLIKGRYKVHAVDSVGRHVVVYRAEDVRLGRPIALEVLRDELASDRAFVAAVRDQAWALAKSAHVHRGVARVYECDATDSGELFVALERTEGPTLRTVLDTRGALDPSAALRIASQVGEALEALHHNRIIHGHLCPDYVVMVTDPDGAEHAALVGVELTSAFRTTLGRHLREASPPPYLAPEQIERGETTDATDVYALGMLLRELLTADTARQTPGTGAATPAVPPPIERIIATACDARPEHRYPDLSVMINDMWGAQTALAGPASRPRSVKRPPTSHRRPARRRHSRPGIAAMLATAAIILAVILWVALSVRIVSFFRTRVATPAATTPPIHQDAAPAAPRSSGVSAPPTEESSVPSPVSASSEATSALPRSHVLEPSAPVAKPHPAPAVPPSVSAPAVGNPPPRPIAARPPTERRAPAGEPAGDAGDGSAIIDWLLQNRR